MTLSRLGLICDACNTLVVSISRHDYRECSCGSVAVDGGGEYSRVVIFPGAIFRQVPVTLKVEGFAKAQGKRRGKRREAA